ncbi:sulfite exporter TauE/SafE family protein [Blastococcus capsensis]|uniref:sulfite exporter TauE/SafE family protein n=1 Tax=Blastococcus capsensis TaxID=1564163 RepID=UPI0025419EE5|nr:sulfite exporter TauE/SafE family protein [Blastococcus capsensis]MDK3258011.1 sulfite exporter TauE/SafE family protein [Blastococcus capsensis]
MSVWEFGFLVLAGIGAGLTGSIAGLASLISYPALLAAGLPPVTANVTNTAALVVVGVGTVSASRPELEGQGRRLLPLMVAGLLGGATGALLLLVTPAGGFEKIVPWLIGAASIAILVQRSPRQLALEGAAARAGCPDQWWLPIAVLAISVYGGYFGAAAGVLMMAMFLLATGEGLPRSNAMRNAVLGVANTVAAIGFAFFASIVWSAALPLAIGLFLGSLLGPRIVRVAPQTALRRIVALAGLGLAIYLAADAYS